MNLHITIIVNSITKNNPEKRFSFNKLRRLIEKTLGIINNKEIIVVTIGTRIVLTILYLPIISLALVIIS
jgi:hypothetical protein